MPRLKRLKDVAKPQVFRTDAPPTDLVGEKDAFGHRAYATAIATALIEVDPPYTFGLFGPFGLGKTTVIEEVRRQLKGRAAVVVFDAWRYEGDTLRRHFLRDVGKQLVRQHELPKTYLVDHLDPLDRTQTEPAGQRFYGLDRGQAVVFLFRVLIASALIWLAWTALPSLGISGSDKDDLWKLAASMLIAVATFVLVPLSQIVKVVDHTTTRSELKPELFAEEFSRMIEAIKSHRLVVAIDNLDRCRADRIEEIFFTLSTYLEPVGSPKHTRRLAIGRDRRKHDAVFLIAADADALKRHLEAQELAASKGAEKVSVLRDDAGRYADDFLRKIIKSSITMKPILADDMRGFVQREMAEFCTLRELDAESSLLLAELATSALRYNPRRVKEFVGNLELQLRVLEARGADGSLKPPIHNDVLLAAKVQLLQEEWADRFDAIWKDYRLLNQWHDDVPANRFDPALGEVDDRFRAFINVSRSISNANLRPLLTLKQARDEAELPRFSEFHAALVEGQTARVDELVSASGVDSSAWASRLEPLLREETRRGFVAGARNLIEVVLTSQELGNGAHVKRILELAAGTPDVRLELRNSSPEVVIRRGAENLDNVDFNRLVEPFLEVGSFYAQSPERGRSVVGALAPFITSLSPDRRATLQSSLGETTIAANFELMQPLVDEDPDLIPETAGAAAVEALTTGAPPPEMSASAIAFVRAWLGRSSISVERQDEIVAFAREGLAQLSEPGSAKPADIANWLNHVIEFVSGLSGPSTAEADALATLLAETLPTVSEVELQAKYLDLANPVLEWLPGSNPPQGETLVEGYYLAHPADLVGYVEDRADVLRPKMTWALHRRLTKVLTSQGNSEELRLRAAAAINRIDPSDREEELGTSIRSLVQLGDLVVAYSLLQDYGEAVEIYRSEIEEAALVYADAQIPAIPQHMYQLLTLLLPNMNDEKIDRVRDILVEQVTTAGVTPDDIEVTFSVADQLAERSSHFESRVDDLVRVTFDALASVDLPDHALLVAVIRRTVRLDEDRRRSLLAQLNRWIRTPGLSQAVAAGAIRALEDATATERHELVAALIDSETAAVGDPVLRFDLLDAARAMQGRGGSRAAKRVESRIHALMSEETDENTALLVRLGLRDEDA